MSEDAPLIARVGATPASRSFTTTNSSTLPLADDDFRDEASRMNALLIGYARVSTYEQDLTAQRVALERLGVDPAYIFTDHGLTGTNRARPGLREALAACRNGDTLVVAKLDRLARSLRDAKDIVDELTAKHVKLSIGGSVHDPLDPVGTTAIQRARDGRSVRVRSDPRSNSRRHAGSESERPPSR